MNAKLAELKATIKSYALAQKQNNQKIRNDQKAGLPTGAAQYHAWKATKKCRCALIAYGLLRGIEYEKIEQPAKDNPPDWAAIEAIRKEHFMEILRKEETHVSEDVRACA